MGVEPSLSRTATKASNKFFHGLLIIHSNRSSIFSYDIEVLLECMSLNMKSSVLLM